MNIENAEKTGKLLNKFNEAKWSLENFEKDFERIFTGYQPLLTRITPEIKSKLKSELKDFIEEDFKKAFKELEEI